MIHNHFGHLFNNMKDYYEAATRIKNWDEPSYTVDTHWRCNYVHPSGGPLMEYKQFDVTPQLKNNGLTVAELFAGGGLMAIGLKAAGYNIVYATDWMKAQCETYKHNFGLDAVCEDITKINPQDIPDVDVIAGGPPCQDFSVAGSGAGEEGERGKLVWDYLAKIEAKQPKAFIFENVKGLVGKKHIHTFNALVERFEAIGYNVAHKVISAWDYGVAQKRERVFIVGIRKDLGFTFVFPEPKPEDYQTQVLRDAIGDLPEPYENHEKDKQLPMYVQNILDGKSKSNFGQMPINDGNEPCSTVLAGYAKKKPGEITNIDGYNRRFTVRECLRIQSVPDWYVIPDNISLSKQYEIVGNGVASKVAYYLGQALSEQLLAATAPSEVTYDGDISIDKQQEEYSLIQILIEQKEKQLEALQQEINQLKRLG